MTISIDKIVDGFPHPNIAPIVGIPTYESIAELNLQLNANAASVQSNLGDGQLGLLALTVSPAVFNTLSAVAFVHPVNPGTNPVIPPGATTHVTSHLTRVFATQKAIFREYHATDNALKQQVIGCVDGMYLRTLSHRVTGYANVTTRQFLVHLYATYGRLSPSDLIANDTKMKSGYDPNLPIESFIDQIEDGVALADAAAAPYSPAQIIAIAYNVLFSTGMFPDACRDWRRRPLLQQTWATFKIDFALAHQELRDSQVTSNQAGYQAAHNAAYDTASYDIQQETALAIANLATATASNRSTVASLTATISNLSTELTLANAKLVHITAELASLRLAMASPLTGIVPTSTPKPKPKSTVPHVPNTNYCWTHGYRVNSTHTSATCPRPDQGHQTAATRSNTMGGSTRTKDA